MNVSFVTSFIDTVIPDVIEVNHLQSILIDLNNKLYYLDVSCSGNCDLALDHLPNSTIKVSFTGIEIGSIVLEFYVNYSNSNFHFRIPISVERPPVFELVSPNVLSTSVNSLVFIHSYSYFDLESYFSFDDSNIEPTNVELLSSSDFFFVYRFELNLTSMPVFEGESVQDLCWSQRGFRRSLVTQIKIYNFEFSSNDHVSVFEHRDISVDFRGNLTSNVTCSIDGQIFFGKVVDILLVCKSVRIPTFQQHVCVDVYYDHFLLNSFEIHGESFLEEVCFESFSRHPLVNSSEIILNRESNLIFDGSRCCSVDVFYCSELISKNELVTFDFPSLFDIHHVIITSNSSCEEIDSGLPFELIVNNHAISPSIICKQIPSGYSFASMCEIDVIFPKISEITLVALEDVYLLEVEFYGYKSNSCFKPFHGEKA
ncbi:hypothetical protein GEMRC1_008516 [Eukaryota sp. GEM-RC1]